MADSQQDKPLKLAAAGVSLVIAVGVIGVFVVKSFAGLIIIVALEAVILIGTGLIIKKEPPPNSPGH